MIRPSLLPLLSCILLAAALAACRHAPPLEAGVCLIQAPDGRLQPLDDGIANLETCGARLEVRWLQQGRPVQGAYGGVYVRIDADGIDAQAPNGPRTRLLNASARRRLDAAIRQLLAAHPAF